MRRTAIAAPLLVSALLTATVAPASARTDSVALGSSTADLTAYMTAFGGYSFPVAAGQKVAVRHYVLAPGQVINWGNRPGTVIGMLDVGDGVTNYLSCSLKQPWKLGHGFYFVRSRAQGTLGGVTVNESKAVAEVYALVTDATGAPQATADLHTDNGQPENPPVAAAGCPTGEPAAMEELGSGVVNASGAFRTDDHEGIAIYTYKVAPGYSSGWHYLTDPGFLIQITGSVDVWSNCESKRVQEPGHAYVNDAPDRPQRISNDGSSAAEFLVVDFNMFDSYPADLGPMTPELPPSDCVDTAVPR